jgi:alpha-amylase
VFDVPLHYNFQQAAEEGSAFDMRKIWDGSLVQSRPIDTVCVG